MEYPEERQVRKRVIGTRRNPQLTLPAEQRLPTLPPVPIITLSDLKKKLPFVLSSWWIEGKNPGNIYQIESPGKGTGFNAIAWQEKDGSKLYLENLDSLGMVDLGSKLKVTLYPKVKSLGEMSGWPNLLPDTIYVNSAGGPRSKMAAKKMVLGLLDFSQNSLKLPNKPILKETQTDPFGSGKFAIEFSVKDIPQIKPIMTIEDFGQKINLANPRVAARSGLRNPQDIYDALKDYQEKLQAGVVNGFRVEVDATGQCFKRSRMLPKISKKPLIQRLKEQNRPF